MKLLTKQKQDDMARQVSLKSRDIDICIFSALEGSLPKEMLLDCLMLYVNKDGGFGHGLYIDNYNVNSSVYQVYEAFRLLDMLDFDYTQPTAQSQTFNMIIKYSDFEYEFVEAEASNWNGEVE